MNDPRTATVVITTRNRKEDLRQAVASAVRQEPAVEVLVLDDGSIDGTAEMVRAEFPSVVLHRFEKSKGSIVQRNRGAELATGEIIFSIDDDAEFSTPHVVQQTLREFAHPRVGAVAIPYTDVKYGPEIRQQAPDAEGVWVKSAFIGTAYALRKNVFLALGGFRELLQHMTEERDYCLRMLGAGMVVKMGRSDLIHHHQSPIRKSGWNRMMERRNDLIYAVSNVPFPQVLLHFPGTILSGLVFGARNRCLAETVSGYFRFLQVFRKALKSRRPVSRQCYFLARYLQRCGVCRLQEIEDRLPPLTVQSMDLGVALPEPDAVRKK